MNTKIISLSNKNLDVFINSLAAKPIAFFYNMPSIQPSKKKMDEFKAWASKMLGIIPENILHAKLSDTPTLYSCLMEALKNAYDAIISISDNKLDFIDLSQNYKGRISIKLSITEHQGNATLNITVTDNGLGNLSATTNDKKHKLSREFVRNFYFGYCSRGIQDSIHKLFHEISKNSEYNLMPAMYQNDQFTGKKTTVSSFLINTTDLKYLSQFSIQKP